MDELDYSEEDIEAARVLFAQPATFMMGAVKMDGMPAPTCRKWPSPAAPTSASPA
jgi:GTP-binding protein